MWHLLIATETKSGLYFLVPTVQKEVASQACLWRLLTLSGPKTEKGNERYSRGESLGSCTSPWGALNWCPCPIEGNGSQLHCQTKTKACLPMASPLACRTSRYFLGDRPLSTQSKYSAEVLSKLPSQIQTLWTPRTVMLLSLILEWYFEISPHLHLRNLPWTIFHGSQDRENNFQYQVLRFFSFNLL